MTKETVFKRMPFLLMAACAAMLAGCDEEKAEPKQEQPAEMVQESGEECLHLLPDSWECFTQPEARESIVAEYYEKMLEKTRKPPS